MFYFYCREKVKRLYKYTNSDAILPELTVNFIRMAGYINVAEQHLQAFALLFSIRRIKKYGFDIKKIVLIDYLIGIGTTRKS